MTRRAVGRHVRIRGVIGHRRLRVPGARLTRRVHWLAGDPGPRKASPLSQLKKIAALAVASVAMVPVLGVASASAAVTDPNLATFNTAVDVSALESLVIARGGCTLTYVGNVLATPVGRPTVSAPVGSVAVNYLPTLNYTVTVTGYTVGYIFCL